MAAGVTYPGADTAHEAQCVACDELIRLRLPRCAARSGRHFKTEAAPWREAIAILLQVGCPSRGGRTLGPGCGPVLTQLAAEFLAGRGPVVADVIAQVLHVTLEVHLVLLEPAHIELLARRATLELARNVLFVVANDPVR